MSRLASWGEGGRRAAQEPRPREARAVPLGLVLGLLLPLASVGAPQSGAEALATAEKLLEDLAYSEASRQLDVAAAATGNSRQTLVRILWLRGVLAGSLNQPEGARSAMRALATIAPEFKPEAGHPARVMTAWFEARGWVESQGSIGLVREPAELGASGVRRIKVRLRADPLELARGLRFHLREGATDWRVVSVALATPVVEVRGTGVQWWVELLGEREAVLASLGQEQEPNVEPDPASVTPPAVSALATRPPAARELAAPPTASRGHGLKGAGYVGVGAALATAAVGAYFGVVANSEATWPSRVAFAPDGAISNLTQRDADRLSGQLRTHATLANGLFIAAGALGVTGVGLWVFGHRLSVSPTPGGVTVGGALP